MTFLFIVACKEKDYSGDNSWLINRGENSLKPIINKSKMVEVDLDSITYDTLSVEKVINGDNEKNPDKKLFISSANDILISNDSLLILDFRQNCIIVSDFNGELKDKIGRFGRGPGEYNSPYCFAMNNKYYFVYDNNNARIQILDRKFKYVKSINYGILPLSMNISASDQYLFVNSPHGIKPKSIETYQLDNMNFQKVGFVDKACSINDYVPEFSGFFDFRFAATPNNSFAAGASNLPFIFLFDEKGKSKISIKFSGSSVNKLKQIQNNSNNKRLLVRSFLNDLICWDNYFIALIRNKYILAFDIKTMRLNKSFVLKQSVAGEIAYSNPNLFISDIFDAKIYKYSLHL